MYIYREKTKVINVLKYKIYNIPNLFRIEIQINFMNAISAFFLF